MNAFNSLRSKTAIIPYADIDTDQIIPARFLTTTTREGLGEHVFADWRYDAEGEPRSDFVLNEADADECQVLVTGRNFGCGSSREHAPWALLDYGIRAVVSTQIADIFRNNALKNGLLPVIVDEKTHAWLLSHPGAEVVIDLEHTRLTLPGGESVRFPIDAFARYCLLHGIDQLGYLQSQRDAISAYEKAHP